MATVERQTGELVRQLEYSEMENRRLRRLVHEQREQRRWELFKAALTTKGEVAWDRWNFDVTWRQVDAALAAYYGDKEGGE